MVTQSFRARLDATELQSHPSKLIAALSLDRVDLLLDPQQTLAQRPDQLSGRRGVFGLLCQVIRRGGDSLPQKITLGDRGGEGHGIPTAEPEPDEDRTEHAPQHETNKHPGCVIAEDIHVAHCVSGHRQAWARRADGVVVSSGGPGRSSACPMLEEAHS